MILRRVAATLIVAALIAAAIPWLFGLQTRLVYNTARDELAARGYPILDESYRLGWLTSDAQLVIGPPTSEPSAGTDPDGEAAPDPAPPMDADQPRVRITTRIAHGPMPRGPPWWPMSLSTLRSRLTVVGGPRRLPPLLLDGGIGLDRSLVLTARMPNVSYAGQEQQLRLSDLSGEIALASPSAPARTDGGLGQLVVGAADGTALSVDGLRWQLRLERIPEVLVMPVGELGVEHLWLRSAAVGEQALEAEEVRIHLALELTSDRLDLSVALDASRLSWRGIRVGPVKIGARLSGLDLEAAQSLRRDLDALGEQPLAASVRGMRQVQLLQHGLPRLFGEDARLLLDPVEVAARQGPISARLVLALRPAGSASTHWWQRLAGEARLGLPQPLLLALLEQQQQDRIADELRRRGEPAEPLPPELADQVADVAQSSLAAMIRERWLVPRQGRLLADLRLEEGVLTVNGRPLPLELPLE